MTNHYNPTLIQSKLISAILPKGVARGVISQLKEEKNIITANLNYARGTGKMTPNKYRSTVVEPEKEILTVVVHEARADEIFEYIYDVANINKPHGGLIYMYPLLHSSEYRLPEIPEESS